jgi:hypothetical protein
MTVFFTIVIMMFSVLLSAENQPVTYKMYPNPMTSDFLDINFNITNKSIKDVDFIITNVIGQVVFSYRLTDDEVKKGTFKIKLDQIKLEKGFYLAKLSAGENSSVQKLIVR